MKQLSKVWAIKMMESGYYRTAFMGVFYFHNYVGLFPHQDGMRTALFKTRRQARESLKNLMLTSIKARVVRVRVTIESV